MSNFVRGAAGLLLALLPASCVAESPDAHRPRPSAVKVVWRDISRALAPSRVEVLEGWGWQRVRSRDELAAVASRPLSTERPVVVYVFAKWFGPTHEFERDVLGDAAIQRCLEAFSLIYLDRTDPGAEEEELMRLLGAETVPRMFVFGSGSELAAALADGNVPTPLVSLDEVVGVDAMLLELNRAAP